ncbi:MAG: hypothetical protein LUQ29_07220 [Methylococcaceae bacterium]|nr:hypothetical protein [Methylococcaceae bacterium]
MLFVPIINPRLINGEQKSLQTRAEEVAIGLTSFDPLLEQDLLKKAATIRNWRTGNLLTLLTAT